MKVAPVRACMLWYVAPGAAEIRDVSLEAPGEGEILAEAAFGALSRGTERLVFAGHVPESEFARMRGPFQRGDFPFPVAYGYCLAGRVVAGPPTLVGRYGFMLHPHATHALLPAEAFIPLPEAVPPRRAVLAANMETALNAVWDAALGPCDRVAVVGAGVVGGLVAHLAARLPGTEVLVVDRDPSRAALAQAIGAGFATPGEAEGEHDVVFHASASGAGLETALRLAGFEAMIVEMSWYGRERVAAPLGEAFHSRRLRLVSSQVGAVSPSRRPRWSRRRRLAAALRLLADPCVETLLGEEVAFLDLPRALPRILASGGGCPVIRY